MRVIFRVSATAFVALQFAATAADAVPRPFVVRLGSIECEFTRSHLDVVKWRDRFVIGDPHSDPRPAARLLLLEKGWKRLAVPTDAHAVEPVVQQGRDQITVRLNGLMDEKNQGAGRWRWEQTWTLDRSGLLRLEYQLHQLAEPSGHWWLHRISLIGNREELFAEYVTDAESPDWLKFKYYATKDDKKLSSFVNVGYYDPDEPDRVRFEGTDEQFERVVRMAI